MASVKDIPTTPGELFAKFQTGFDADAGDAVFRALGVSCLLDGRLNTTPRNADQWTRLGAGADPQIGESEWSRDNRKAPPLPVGPSCLLRK